MSTKVLLKKSSVLGKVPLATDLSYGELALNYADGKLYFKDSNNNVKSFTEDSSVVTLAGTQTLSNKTLVDPLVEGKVTYKAAGGDEGGEFLLEKALTNTTIAGSGVTIDIYQNKLRIFETGGTNRGVYIDITAAAAGVGTNVLTGSSGGTGPDADTLDGFDSSYFLNYNNLLNKPTIPTLTSQLTNDSGYLTTTSSIDWSQIVNEPEFATVATSGSYTDLINTPTLFSGDYNDLSNKPVLTKAAVQWTANHTLADGTRYLAGDVVYDNGNIFVANFDNESLPTSNTTYWTDLGSGNRLNIDGRDIPNITYAQLTGTPTLFSGNYNDLTNLPTLFSGDYADLTGKPFIPTKTSDITNDSGYITGLDLFGYATESYVTTAINGKQDTLVSGTSIKTINGQSLLGSGDIVITGGITSESDPVYATSSWYTTTNNASNWDTAYGWGNHASAGYLTSTSSIDWSQIVNEPALFSGDYNDLTNKPTIPTVPTLVSAFTNDANYVNTTQLATKQDELVSGTSIKTINGESILGSGNITITGGSASSLNDLTDVDTETTAPTNGQALVYSSGASKWVPQTISGGSSDPEQSVTVYSGDGLLIDTFDATVYSGGTYTVVAANDLGYYESVELFVVHNGTTVTLARGSRTLITSSVGNFNATISGNVVSVILNAAITGSNTTQVRFKRSLFSAFASFGIPLPTDLELESFPLIDLETQTYPTKDLN